MARSKFLSDDFIDTLGEEQAREAIRPYMTTFRDCVEEGLRAVERMEKEHDEFFHVYPTGARATLVFWQIVNLAEARFQGMDGVSASHKRGFLTILVDDKLEIRFKKLSRSDRSADSRTRHARSYKLQLRLAGMEEPTRATAGYKLASDGTLKDILVICPKGDEILWRIPLPPSDAAVSHPANEAPPSGDKPKVRPKRA